MHPRQMRDTVTPVLPSFVYCIGSPLRFPTHETGVRRQKRFTQKKCQGQVYAQRAVRQAHSEEGANGKPAAGGVNILDEDIGLSQRHRLTAWKIHYRQIGVET